MNNYTKAIIAVAGLITVGTTAWYLAKPPKKKKKAIEGTDGNSPLGEGGTSSIPPRAPLLQWTEQLRPEATRLAEEKFQDLGAPTFSWDTVATIASSVARDLFPGSPVKWPTTSSSSDAFLIGKKMGWIPWSKIFDISMKAMGYSPEYGPITTGK